MRDLVLSVILTLLSGVSALAQGWHEPARGTAERKALMDALRPHAEWVLGAPVEFVIYDLRVRGNLGFASVWPQRPGGGEIDLWATPGAYRQEIYPDDMDGAGIEALYVKSGNTWVAVHWAIGAGDVWWAWEPICAVWRAVVPEACQGM